MKILASLLAVLQGLITVWQSYQRKLKQQRASNEHKAIDDDTNAALRERNWMRDDAPADYVPKSSGTLSEDYSARLHDKRE
jgi:hypothetical protein